MKRDNRFWILNLGWVTAFTFGLFGGPVQAETLKLSLDDAVKMALKQNPDVQMAGEKVVATRGKYVESRSGALPKLDLTSTYTRLAPVPGVTLPPAFGGGEIKMGYADNYDLKLSLSQSIFSWDKVQNGYRAASDQVKSSQEDSAKTRQETIASVTKAYYGVLVTQEFIRVSEEALARVQEQERVVSKRYEAGTVSKFDLLRTQVQVANTKPQVEKAHDGYAMTLLALKNLIGVPLDSPMELSGSLSYEPMTVDLKAATQTAVDRRPDLKSLTYQKMALEHTLSIAKAALRPNLSLAATYDYKRPGPNGEDKWGQSATASAILYTPLFDGFSSSGRVAQVASGVRQLEIAQKQAEEGVALEVNSAVLALREAQANIESQKENVDLAKESLRIGKVRYDSGLITNLEILDAELAVTQAETNYLQALYDFQTARVNLKKAMGEL
jgi:TolC family type I secretion outer membrane protein